MKISAWLAVLVGGVCAVSGCGSGAAPTLQTANDAQQAAAANGSGSDARSVAANSARDAQTIIEQPRRTSMDGIPLDVWPEVWFEDPLAVARVDATALPAAVLAPAAPTISQDSASAQPAAAASTKDEDWKTVCPMSVLEAETKRLRSSVSQSLQSVGRFNANRNAIKIDAATLAAVAGIVAAHPDPVRWKENAKFVRDLAADVASNAKQPGGDAYRKTRAAFEPIAEILDGNEPAELPEALAAVDFSEVASRGGLMKRMDAAYQWMKSNVTDESALQAEAETVTHEAGMAAALASVILAKGYVGADEKEYQEYARQIVTGCGKVMAAARDKRMEDFEQGFIQIQRSCNDCHAEYRFADGM